MPSDELTAEIEAAAAEMDINETVDEEEVATKASREAADASAQSDEDKAAAEIASDDKAADTLVAAEDESAIKLADEEGAAAEGAGKEVAITEEARIAAAEAAEAKSADPVVISDGVLERAVSFGIPLASARKFIDEASLNAAVDSLERAEEIIGRSGEQTETSLEPKDPFADLPKLDPEVHGAEVTETFERYAELLKQQQETIQSLQGRQEETSLAAQTRAVAEIEQWFDKEVAGLGKEFSEALGEGSFKSLSQGSSQYAKREAIAKQVSIMLAGYDATDQPRPPREELFNTAAKLVLADEYQKIRDGKVAGKLEAQASQHLQRAGGSKASGVQTPEDEAAAAIDAKYG